MKHIFCAKTLKWGSALCFTSFQNTSKHFFLKKEKDPIAILIILAEDKVVETQTSISIGLLKSSIFALSKYIIKLITDVINPREPTVTYV